jgi:O-antigen ligase
MGAAAGLAGFMWLARRRMARTGMGWLVAIAATIVAAAATFASWSALTTRVEETISVGLGGRREIWDTTLAMAAEFRLTGVGVGAYERAMTVYQRQPHVFYFNHAHNEYLQMLAEGGVMLAVPAVLAAAGAAWRIWRALDADRSAIFWIRAGAASGLLAVAVQSIWDTGLRVPASAVLFSMLAGLALHEGP